MKGRQLEAGAALGAHISRRSAHATGEAVGQCSTCGGEFSPDLEVCPRDDSPLTKATADALQGVVLGETYRILRRLAVGGMGRVFEAEHVRLPLRFAIKVLHEASAHRTESLQRFEREALETARLRSEHIVGVVDLLRTPDSRPCIVAEYLDGETLRERLGRQGRFEPYQAVSFAIEMCRGLSVAHEAGVVHRDLKPSNIFLARAGAEREVVKLVDFGVAKVEDHRHLTETGAFLGTPAYMAPEQAAGRADLDHRADVYAVGAVLYEMVTGEPPYGTDDATTTLQKLLRGEPPRARNLQSSVPPALEAIIERAMARDPKLRYPDAESMRVELASFARTRDKVGSARDLVHAAENRRARLERPTAIAVIAAAAVLASGWAGIIGAELLYQHVDVATLSDPARLALLVVPVGAGIAVLVAAGRALFTAWRSSPRVRRLERAFRNAIFFGLVALALGELLSAALRAFRLDAGAPNHIERLVVLGVSGLVFVTALVVTRFASREPG